MMPILAKFHSFAYCQNIADKIKSKVIVLENKMRKRRQNSPKISSSEVLSQKKKELRNLSSGVMQRVRSNQKMLIGIREDSLERYETYMPRNKNRDWFLALDLTVIVLIVVVSEFIKNYGKPY
jgi:predicted RNase H-like nuclease